MRKIITLITAFTIALVSSSQIYVGDITLITQEEVDNFSTNYPGITYIEGTLFVSPYSAQEDIFIDPILDLSGLSQLNGAKDIRIEQGMGFTGWIPTFAENVYIYSNIDASGGELNLDQFTSEFTALNNLYLSFESIENADLGATLFENLTSVDSLTIQWLGAAVTFPNLQSINYFHYWNFNVVNLYMPSVTSLNTLISENFNYDALISTPYFPNLNHIERFVISGSLVMDGFIGLSSLTSIGTFDSRHNDGMHSLSGLTNIQTADNIYIWAYFGVNGEPAPLIGLESLESVGNLSIEQSSFSGDFSSLSNLQEVDSLRIHGVYEVPSLAGLENLTINNYLELRESSFSICNVPSVCNFLSTHGPQDYFIDVNNPTGCSTAEEILASCSPAEVDIFGSVYFDSNCNGTFDSNEFTISPTYIQPVAGADLFLGLESFSLNAPPETALTIEVGGLPAYYAAGAPINITTPPFGGNVVSQNIAVCPAFPFNDLQASLLHSGYLTPGFGSNLRLLIENLGSTTAQIIPTMILNTDQFLAEFNVVDSQFSGTIVGNTITWPELTISPGQTLDLWIYLELLPTATILGEIFSVSAEVALVSGNDENPADNTALFEQEIIGSYDPNDKWVNTPQINIETIDPTQPLDLTYRVRFQNTGTAPAVNVRVEDILEDDLDPSSFQLLSSTHDVYYQIEGNQINFFFDNIMLPDSTSDPEGSIGTFFFRIKSNGNHTLESSIDNQVSIFFDFNEPIITNVASTIFYNCPVVNISGEGADLCEGEEVELSAVASNNTSIQWLINEEVVSSSNNYLFSFDEPNDYSVLVIAENEYCIDEDELEITVNENPEVSLILDGSTLIATEGFASYQWTLDGNIIEGENGNTITSAAPGNYVVTVTNEFGCSDESDVVEVVSSISENESNAIVFWPNPVKDVVNISLEENIQNEVIQIFDATGKIIYQNQINGKIFQLDTSAWPAGIYNLRIQNHLNSKIIKL